MIACRYYQAADIWAFGILLMELATGHAPYANFSLTNIIIMTMHSPVPELERTFSDVSCIPNVTVTVVVILTVAVSLTVASHVWLC